MGLESAGRGSVVRSTTGLRSTTGTAAPRRTPRDGRPRAFAAGLLLLFAAAGFAPHARAALFEDDDARRAILDLRQGAEQARARQAESAAQLAEQIAQLRRSLLDLNGQLEALRGELARLRGQDEQLARDVSEVQRRQKDIQQGVDERLRRFEPQQVTLDDRQFAAEPDEKRLYDEAIATLRKGDFAAASGAFGTFLKRYPSSGYREAALFWHGNALYGKRDYKEAVASFRALVAAAPDSARAPEALLSIATCQIELKDRAAARKTLDELVKNYPKSEAADAGRERLTSLK